MNKSHLRGAMCACLASCISMTSHTVGGQGMWETFLEARDFDGNTSTIEGYHDNVLGITWMADANYAQTSGFDTDGLMTWAASNSWAAGLNVAGITGWRLPTTTQPDASCSNQFDPGGGFPLQGVGTSCTGSEMGHLNNVVGITAAAPGPFFKIQFNRYWSSTAYAANTYDAWDYNFDNGIQGASTMLASSYAWAVHDGDVGAPIVPTPIYSCIGDMFEPPFSQSISLKNKVKKAIPVKMSLVGANGNLIAETDISSPPVINVFYRPGVGIDNNNDSDLVPSGLSDDGNEFRFEYPYWVLNLATKQFSSAGTYEVTAVPGDESYLIDASSCAGEFVRLP